MRRVAPRPARTLTDLLADVGLGPGDDDGAGRDVAAVLRKVDRRTEERRPMQAVDEAVDDAAGEQVEVAEHPSIYESIDQLLRDRLATRLDATQ